LGMSNMGAKVHFIEPTTSGSGEIKNVVEDIPTLGMEEENYYKDVELVFVEPKDKEVELVEPKKEDSNDEGLEEVVPHRSRRKLVRIVREEKINKDIMMGSKTTIEMVGIEPKPMKAAGTNASSKGDNPKARGK